jgi:oxygen-independent coproporphyrinogen-3 oxidase
VVPAAEFVKAIAAELAARVSNGSGVPITTLYLGGGTPSKLGPDGVGLLLENVRRHPGLEFSPDAEVTLETNPEDVTRAAAASWLASGVNRLSLGAQSFDDRALLWMHRTHDDEAISCAMTAARDAGFDDISLDMIFALPDELDRDWRADLTQAVALEPSHLSLYGLTVEPRTPLGRWAARGEVKEAPHERYADEFLLADEVLAESGFEHYEVSNFARNGRRSAHNQSYWRRTPYLGLGPSAHSYDGSARRWNVREFDAWKTSALEGNDPVEGTEMLTQSNIDSEEVYLGLRTSDGLSMHAEDAPTVAKWADAGWARMVGNRVVLSPEGWLRLDSLAAALTAVRSR